MLTELCLDLLSRLKPSERAELVRLVISSGYAAKDVSKMMDVSPSAVSRYVSGTLNPPEERVCRLISLVDDETRIRLYTTALEKLWNTMKKALTHLIQQDPATIGIVEKIADDTATLLLIAKRQKQAAHPSLKRQARQYYTL